MARHILDLPAMQQLDPVPKTAVWWLTGGGLWLLQNRRGVRVELEGFQQPERPVLYAMNHSHYFDFMQSRRALWMQHRVQTSTFVKTRAFQNRVEGAYMKLMGNIPLVSRGYLISADYAELFGDKPDEATYRVLRGHLDHGTPLPEGEVFDALQGTARAMLGAGFDPAEGAYREALHGCYASAMATTLGHARAAAERGTSLHIYPQGLFSTRLSRGRIGAVQIAFALGLEVVPVGFSGMNELFEKNRMVPRSGGTLTMRFGAPYRIDRPELAGFRPFHPDDEARLRPVLEAETQALMERINDLLDPAYTWSDDRIGDGLTGIQRFFD